MISKKNHDLYQVYATECKTGLLTTVPFFPRAKKETCEEWCDLMVKKIIEGKEKRYVSPMVLLFMQPE